ncbi:similar to Saccharomyces cerevisiae YJR092W BUD4 Involved in bud-site selection and required for the axial budding pattern [Maudiozyma saulgeensis]|uniref:Similar to Saccharomyces cerevisiae YJR092W BUD4 Involved in bud-site selection and required for the axial budding pattern n=1 Tax=Maudiozyma saulgeensis TaxID=1789683 RepID=A0A1X7R641_9SACH|nr:similar to Saccharomyces cerevisiae YJR092W BUD4 Involved in bud-site selection and required for the axial budding pattern [Kazachstania saulgeensis]
MDSESTVNLLIQDIDEEVMQKEIPNISGNDMNATDPEEPLNLPGSNSSSSMDSVKHVDISQSPEDTSDTSTNIESTHHYELAAPVKLLAKESDPLVTPDLKNTATEIMSGPTLASAANRVYMNRSPSSSTERLRDMLKEEAADIEHELESDTGILTNPTAPKRFSLGSTKPLLPYNGAQADDQNSIARYVSNSDADYMDSTFDGVSNEVGEQSPLVQHSPFKIPVSNIVSINQFTSNYGTNKMVDNSSNRCLLEDQGDDLQDIITKEQQTTSSLFATQPPSIPPTPEMRPLTGSENLENDNINYSKKFNTRIFSMATTIGDYESALEQQSDVASMVQCIDEPDNASELDIIDTLNISSTVDHFEENNTSDNNQLNNNTFMGSVLPSIGSIQLEKGSSSCDNSTSSANESESVYKISLENEKLMEYTNQKILQTEDKIEKIIEDTYVPTSTLPISQDEDEMIALSESSQASTGTDASHIITIDEPSSVTSSSKSSVGEDLSEIPPTPKISSTVQPLENFEGDDNDVLDDGSLIETLPEIDIDIADNVESDLEDDNGKNNVSSLITCREPDNISYEESHPINQLDNSLDIDLSPVLLDATHSDSEKSTSEPARTISKDSEIVKTILPEVPGFEPLLLESPFDVEADSSFGSTKSEDPNKPTNYLNVWHIQESSHMPERKLSVTNRPVEAPKSISQNVSLYSFKPILVHRPKIHYSESSTKTNIQKDPLIGDDCIAESFSTDFEYLLNQISTDDCSIDERIQEPSYGHLNIWNKEKDILHPSSMKTENTDPHKKLNIEQMIGQDEQGIMKSQIKNVIVGKASSIKSFQVDSDDNASSINGESIYKDALETPTKLNETESKAYPTGNHIDSPFKVIPDSSNESPTRAVGGNPFFTSNMHTKDNFTKPILTDLKFTNREFSEELDEPSTPVVLKSEPKDQNEVGTQAEIKNGQDEADQFIVIENSQNDPPDNGIVYVLLNKIKVELSDVARHDPKFSLEIDNGINVVNTPWTALSNDQFLDLGKELEIPIRTLNQTIYLTLKCRYTRPQFELYEVMEKVKIGKRYHGLGKTDYRYEKRYKQKKLQTDAWDYIFAPDGSFACAEIHLDEKFLNACKFKENHDVAINLENRWGRLKQTSQNLGADSKPLKRKPYNIGSISLDTCYLQRSSCLERFPKSLNLVHDMVGRLKTQRSIKKEGPLLQEGGDLQGLLKKRYFKLEGNTLTGYHEVSRKAKIDINLLSAIDVIDNNDFQSKKATNRDFTNLVLFGESFKIIFQDGETISFNSDTSVTETRDWYNKIKESVSLNVVHQPWVKRVIDTTS